MDFLLIFVLTLLNGAFAMSELALTASRKVRLQTMAEAGDKGAQAALDLLDNPTQFLSSVQVGITSIGMLNGIVAFELKILDLQTKVKINQHRPESHAAMHAGLHTGPKKQGTRLVKCTCTVCEATWRMTAKWIDVAEEGEGLRCPVCGCRP